MDVGGSKGWSGKTKLKMNHEYKEKNLERKTKTEPYQNPPSRSIHEPLSDINEDYMFRYIYAGIDLFDRLIREAREEFEDKKSYYRA